LSTRAVLVLAALGCIWGASFLFIKVIVEETSPFTLVAGRLTLGALPLLVIIALHRPAIVERRSILSKTLFTAVFATALPFLMISWGEEHIDSGIAAVLNSTVPLWTALLTAALLSHERLAGRELAGVALGFGGVLVVTGSDITHIGDSDMLGQLAVVGAALSYAVALVYARAKLAEEDPVMVATLQVVMGALIMWPVAFAAARGTPDIDVSTKAWLSWVTLGMLGTGIAYIGYYWLIASVGVLASTVTYIPPVIGLALGAVVLDEAIGLNVVVGAAIIIVGVMLLAGRLEFVARAIRVLQPQERL
jgi:drug/metabolite transporter (DMT)-like permease